MGWMWRRLKILRLHTGLNQEQPLEIVFDFLGAHVVRRNFGQEDGAEQYLHVDGEIVAEVVVGAGGVCECVLRSRAFTVGQSKSC